MIIETRSAKETYDLGKKIGSHAKAGEVYTLVGDLGVEAAFRARKDVLGVGAADKDEVRGERADACHREQVAASRFFGHRSEPRTVEQPGECGLCDSSEILWLPTG